MDTTDLYSLVLAVFQPVPYTRHSNDICNAVSRIREKLFQVRMSEYEYKQLQQEAEKQGVPMADLFRKFVATLPKPSEDKKPS
ncbi:hypothetical protein NDI39_16515 [Microcoleus sp. ZQ-A2]